MNVKEALHKAQEVINERGWHQGWLVDDCGKGVCLIGAVGVACGGEVIQLAPATPNSPARWTVNHDKITYAEQVELADACDAVTKLLREKGELEDPEFPNSTGISLPEWNDMKGRSVEDVLLILKEAEANA